MQLLTLLQLIISGCTLIGLIVGFYKYFRDPNVKASQAIELMKQKCSITHTRLNEELTAIKENHLAHIEKEMGYLKETVIRVETILNIILKKQNK